MISCNVNVKNEVEKWVTQDGLLFLRKIGVKVSYILVDFGCNVGHYTIPAAKVIGNKGKVYAVDKDADILSKLMRTALAENLKNIIPVKTSGNPRIDLENESVDIVLLYDILHYFTIQERTTLYKEVYRILKVNGLLSVYPKHNSSDEPLWNLSNLKLKEIISEIEGSNLHLFDEKYGELLHNDNFDKGYVLNFKKSEGI
jgi:ubiquinone/menaquinone biosynthesis C-methylase UbiE